MQPLVRSLSLIPTLLVLATASVADPHLPADSGPRVRVSGDAELFVAPDEVRLQVAVETEDRDSRAAAKENARRTRAVLAALESVAGREGEVKTLGYALNPQYDFHRNGQRELRGYMATNTIELRTRELDRVGEAIDAATEAGANRVDRLVFGLRDDLAARRDALRQATLRAQAKAQSAAAALGLEIVRVVRLDEGGGGVISPRADGMVRARSMEAAAATPVQSGTIEVRAQVTLEVELAR